jgi:SAM-dependent methyltransferase
MRGVHNHQEAAAKPSFRHEDLYESPPPWDIGRPQPALRALADAGVIRGRVLDAGCGTGEHALMASGLGLDATGIDLAGNALRTAEGKARERGLTTRFLHHDARTVAELGEVFDTVLDCGLFHLFDTAGRAAYVEGLRSVLAPGGRYFMLGFRGGPTAGSRRRTGGPVRGGAPAYLGGDRGCVHRRLARRLD